MPDSVVQLTNVTKTYQVGAEKVRAVRGVSLAVPARRFTMLVGPSGSGKTTLLNLIGCIDVPSAGTVEIAGQDVARLADNALSDFRAKKVGFIFQGFSLVPVLSAYENVEYPLLLTGISPAERRRTTLAMLEAVGLTAQRSQRPNELSGGEKQAAALPPGPVNRPALVRAHAANAQIHSPTRARIIEIKRPTPIQSHTPLIFSS